MNPYPAYKPSNINWIGNIPKTWNITKLRYCGKFFTGSTPSSGNESFWNGDIIWVTPEDLSSPSIFYLADSKRKITQLGLNDIGGELVPECTIIISTRAPIGNMAITSAQLCFNQGCKAIEVDTERFHCEFVFYCLYTSKAQLQALGKGTTFTELSTQSLKDFIIPFPLLDEQITIANYLVEKTTQIDKLIANKQKLIELLKEERTAIINEAVSGEGKNWERKKLKYVANVVLGKMLTSDDKGGFFLKPYLRAANMQWLSVNISSIKEMWFSPNELEKLRVKKYDLLVSEGGEVGRTCIWNDELDECYIQNSVHKITFKEGLNPFFFLYQFFSLGSIGYFDSIVNRISIAHLTGEKLNDIFVYYPTLKEQNKIVEHIQTQTHRIDETITKIEKEIELMGEYRIALISEVVTGKIKVTT